MRLHVPTYRWVMPGLVAFAVLFTPANPWPEQPEHIRGPLGPRILAPTVREAVAAANSRAEPQHIAVAELRSRPGSLAAALPSAAAVVLLVVTLLASGLPEHRSILYAILRGLVPRGPPRAQLA